MMEKTIRVYENNSNEAKIILFADELLSVVLNEKIEKITYSDFEKFSELIQGELIEKDYKVYNYINYATIARALNFYPNLFIGKNDLIYARHPNQKIRAQYSDSIIQTIKNLALSYWTQGENV